MTRRSTGLLLTLVLLAVAARLLTARVLYPAAPQDENSKIAHNVTAGLGYSYREYGQLHPTAVRPPVYPLLLAGVYEVFGMETRSSAIVAAATNAVAGGVATFLAFRIGRRLFGRDVAPSTDRSSRSPPVPTGAWVFAVIIAVWPTGLIAAAYQQGLTIALCLMLAAILLLLPKDHANTKASSPNRAAVGGLLAGLAVLTESLLLLPLVAIIIWLGRRSLATLLLALAALAVMILPWTLRNAAVYQQVIGLTDQFWRDAFVGNGPEATGSEHLNRSADTQSARSFISRLNPQDSDRFRAATPPERLQLFRSWTLDIVRTQPLRVVKLSCTRLAKTLLFDWHHPKSLNPVHVAARLIMLAAFLAAVAILFTDHRSGQIGVHQTRSAVSLALISMLGLCLSTAFTLVEARNEVFADVPQGLALATLCHLRRTEAVT